MKYIRLLILVMLALFVRSCSISDDNEGCKCRGEFKLFSNIQGNSFWGDGADCRTGEPYMQRQIDIGHPAIFLGCVD